ncbi:MAG: hypothetical protein KGK00_16415 [Paracoccaceae bacterium]|nr:hypothetical protein [Paracoccaceae bacterium]
MAGTRKPKETPEDQPKAETEGQATEAQTEAAGEPEVSEAAVVEEPAAEPVATDPVPENVEPPPAPQPPEAQPAPKRGGGWIGPILGGVIAAGIGFGAAHYVVPQGWPLGPAPHQLDALNQRLAADEAALKAATAERESLKSALTSVQGAAASLDARLKTAEDQAGAAATQVDALKAQISALQKDIAGLDDRVTKLEARPIAAAGAAGSSDATAVLTALRTQIADQQKANADLADQVKALSDKANARIDAAEQEAKAAKAQAEATSQSALAQAALTRVQTAIDLGGPFEGPLSALAAQGVTVPEALSSVAAKGVVTQAALQSQFAPAARVALEASIKATMGDGIGSRLMAFLRTQTGLHSLKPRKGNDPDAILSRAEADVRNADLSAALKEIATLPPAGQTAMQDWTAKAKARLAAVDAMTALAQTVGKK